MKDIIRKIPKVDLHCHIDGSVRVSTIKEIAELQGYKLPTYDVEELKKYVTVSKDCRSLSDFLKRFEVFYPILKDTLALERITYELIEDAYKENIVYLEARFAPVLQSKKDLSMEEVLKSVLKGKEKAEKNFSVKTGIILCVYRGTEKESWFETVELANKYKREGVCGIDLAGDESMYRAEIYKDAFDLAKRYSLNITVHAGEAAGPESIKDAIDKLYARRIGHGVKLEKDKFLYERVKEAKIPLEMCPTSNIQTEVVSTYREHPLKRYYEDGIRTTVNTDDRGVSDIDLTHEWKVVIDKIGMKFEDLLDMNINSIEAAFLKSEEKEKIKEYIQNKTAEVLKKGGLGGQ